jgi:IS1 family transposase
VFHNKVSDRVKQRERSKTCKFWITRDESSSTIVSSVEGKRTDESNEQLLGWFTDKKVTVDTDGVWTTAKVQ